MTTKNNIDSNSDCPIIVIKKSMDWLKVINTGCYQIGYYLQTDPRKETCEDGLLINHDKNNLLIAVCDGVGSSDRSYRASKTALEYLSQLPINIKQDDMEQELLTINKKLIGLDGSPQTTLSMIVFSGDEYINYQIGDSGAIHCSNQGNLKLRSIMHSPVGTMLFEHKITEQDALQHPELHIVDNVLGDDECFVDTSSPKEFTRYDSLILSSDGLLDNFLTSDIISLISKNSIEESCTKIVDSSKQYTNLITNDKFYKIDDISFICVKKTE